jgi:hypothetical protein
MSNENFKLIYVVVCNFSFGHKNFIKVGESVLGEEARRMAAYITPDADIDYARSFAFKVHEECTKGLMWYFRTFLKQWERDISIGGRDHELLFDIGALYAINTIRAGLELNHECMPINMAIEAAKDLKTRPIKAKYLKSLVTK